MDAKTHWEQIYGTKAPDQVSWYRPHLETSRALIERAATVCSGPPETRRTVEESLDFADSLRLDALKIAVGIGIYPHSI
jgi:hypothetical protein